MADRIYLAGPMTGQPAYNAEEFRLYKRLWEGAGWEVVTPLDTNSIVWRREHGRDFDPETDICDYGHPSLGAMVVENIRALVAAGNIGLLPGWQASRGATLEYEIATALQCTIYDASTLMPLPRESVCAEADRLVSGDRQADYGHPFEDFTRTGRIWGALLGLPDIDPAVVGLMMGGVKMSREVHRPKRDNLVDLAGYAKTVDLVRQRQGR